MYTAFPTDPGAGNPTRVSQAVFDHFGLSSAELRVVLAVMAHERLFGRGCTSRQIEADLGLNTGHFTPWVRARWLLADAQCVWTARRRAWVELGFRREECLLMTVTSVTATFVGVQPEERQARAS